MVFVLGRMGGKRATIMNNMDFLRESIDDRWVVINHHDVLYYVTLLQNMAVMWDNLIRRPASISSLK